MEWTAIVRGRLLHVWERVRSSYWFVPTVLSVLGIVLSVVLVAVDRQQGAVWLDEASWLYQGSAEGARALLAAVAGSMITVAGVTFSITIVVLSLASSQFGPRILRNFMRDTGNEIVLGTFVATFLYCLLVLRSVRGGDNPFVPHLAVSFGVFTALASIGVLIYFIHHVSGLIQVDNVVAAASHDLERVLDHPFPEIDPDRAARGEEILAGESIVILGTLTGYVQNVDAGGLLDLATEREWVIRVLARPGQFVVQGQAVAEVWGATGGEEVDVGHAVRERFYVGAGRTPNHDLVAAIQQLVEIGVRALSPGINDPFTAVTCVHRVSAALCGFVRRPPPARRYFDDGGHLRLVAEPITFAELSGAGFDMLRYYGRSSAEVLVGLLEAVREVSLCAADPGVRAVLSSHVERFREAAEQGDLVESDRERVRRACVEVSARLAG